MNKANSESPKENSIKELEKDVLVTQEQVEKTIDRMARSGLKDYLDYLSSPARIFFTNFLAGMARGLGFLIGATIVLSIVFFIIGHVLAKIPIIGEAFEWLNQFLEESLKQKM